MIEDIKSILIEINTVGCEKKSKEKLSVFLDKLLEENYPNSLNESEDEAVKSPPHYLIEGRKETIVEIYEDILVEEKDLYNAYCAGNIWKYVSRFSKKNGAEDIKKAKQYTQFLKITNIRTFL